MTRAMVPVQYFGKLPYRGDFVRSAVSSALIQSLDKWMSAGIELMAEDVHWKQMYDQAQGVHFAMLNPQRGSALVGHLVPSADASGRRFPFLMVIPQDMAASAQSLALAPLLFQSTWTTLHDDARQARHSPAEEAERCLQRLQQARTPAAADATVQQREYDAFLHQTSLSSFVQTLGASVSMESLRQLLLALGLLLQPLIDAPPQAVDKGLCLPLPAPVWARSLFAAFWTDLLSMFVGARGHDLTLVLPEDDRDAQGLRISFTAGAPQVLQALMDARRSADVFIPMTDTDWIHSVINQDYGLKKFSSYLQQPSLSMAQVRRSFQEAFLGV